MLVNFEPVGMCYVMVLWPMLLKTKMKNYVLSMLAQTIIMYYVQYSVLQ